jgi:phytoene desaturase
VVHELFQDIGCSSLPIELEPIDPLCRYFWDDGSVLEASSDVQRMMSSFESILPGEGQGFLRFLKHGQRLYRAAVETFLFHPFGSLRPAELAGLAWMIPRVFQIDALRTYERSIATFFRDRRIRQFFLRFATYNGSSPYRTPATMAVIPYIELTFGGWYIKGGMYRLAAAMEELARQKAVAIRTRADVRRILVHNGKACGVELHSGEAVDADAVLTNADAEYTDRVLLERPQDARRCQPSLSGFLLLLGVRKRFPMAGHHTILFSADYRAEFDALVGSGTLPDDPTIYICNSSSSDASQAPPGCSNLYVLINAPSLASHGGRSLDWDSLAVRCREVIMNKLHRFGFAVSEREIEVERHITPHDFEKRFNAVHGALYGQGSNTRRAAFFRPPNRSRSYKGLYYAGGSVHPGGGIPLVLLSGKHAADLIRKDLCD